MVKGIVSVHLDMRRIGTRFEHARKDRKMCVSACLCVYVCVVTCDGDVADDREFAFGPCK